ncbi:MobA/MobL family protein [Megamonas sp. Calf98-2]|uniref:MobA/MobL family protein n=1 Tax=Megamonas sp. Calf98-2 TaxID=1855330 RepID=UPI0008C73381|nr:MobA/MobL family protein [Megamonas sp. Calf98-2]SEN70707.1 MobA/MobL family protein [Megamonas sp. Calf98-2]
MASYHFSVKCGNYNGRKTSATNHLNYINRDGQFKNLDKKNNSNKQVNECIYKENFLPAWAEGSAKKFWSSAEKYERANACVYKELEFNLMNELTLKENLKIINDILKVEPMNKFYYSLVIHDKQKSAISGERNLHCHLMFCEREIDGIERDAKTFFKRYNSKNPTLGGARKSILFNDRKIGKQTVKNLRDEYAKIVNTILKENNIEQTISSKSLKEQYEEAIKKRDLLKAKILDREPERHLGRKLSKDVNLKKDLLEIRSFNKEILSKLNSQKEKTVNSFNRYTALQVDNILKNFSQELTNNISKLQKDLEKIYPKVISEKQAKIMAVDIATKGKYKKFRELITKIKDNNDDINKQYAINLKQDIVNYLSKPEVKMYISKIVNGILEKNLPIKNNYNKLNSNLNKMRLQLHTIGKLRKATGKQIKADKGKNITYEVKAKDNLSTGGAGDTNYNKINNAKILAEAFAGNYSLGALVAKIVDDKYDEFRDNITSNKADRLSQETDSALSL